MKREMCQIAELKIYVHERYIRRFYEPNVSQY